MKRGFLLVLVLLVATLSVSSQQLPDFGAKFTSYTEKLPFQKKNINCIQANEKVVWVGTNLGLAQVIGDDINYINIRGTEQYSVNTMFSDEKGGNWLGTRINSIIQPRNKKYESIPLPGGADIKVNALHLSGNKLWVGTNKGGIYGVHTQSGAIESVASSYKGAVNSVFSEKGKLKLVGRDNGLFYNPNQYQWQQFKRVKSVSDIIEQGGTFWVLGKNQNGTPIILKSTDKIKWNDFHINCVAQNNMVFYDFDLDDSGRNLWVGTNIGVLQYNFEDEVCNLFTQSHYPDFKMRAVHHLSVQNDSTIWVGSDKGDLYKLTIYPLDKEEEEEEKTEDIVADARTKKDNKKENKRKKEREAAKTERKKAETGPPPKPPISIRAKKQKSLVNFDDIKCNETLELSELYFVPSSSNFLNGQTARQYLDILVLYLKQNPSHNIELYGHTDILSNNKQYLLELSQQRVDKVADYLGSKGIKKKRINAIAYGGEKPIITNKTDKNRNQNRRVEVQIMCE